MELTGPIIKVSNEIDNLPLLHAHGGIHQYMFVTQLEDIGALEHRAQFSQAFYTVADERPINEVFRTVQTHFTKAIGFIV